MILWDMTRILMPPVDKEELDSEFLLQYFFYDNIQEVDLFFLQKQHS